MGWKLWVISKLDDCWTEIIVDKIQQHDNEALNCDRYKLKQKWFLSHRQKHSQYCWRLCLNRKFVLDALKPKKVLDGDWLNNKVWQNICHTHSAVVSATKPAAVTAVSTQEPASDATTAMYHARTLAACHGVTHNTRQFSVPFANISKLFIVIIIE